MKTFQNLDIYFKEIEFICKCGETQKEDILLEGNYGFHSTTCKNCGKKIIIEYDDGFINVKSF